MLNDRASDRDAFLFSIEHELTTAPESIAVMRIDLDRFARIRETFGAGAARLVRNRLVTRMEALAGRSQRLLAYGPDSFLAAMDVGSNDDGYLHERAMEAIDTISEPMDIEGHRIAVGCSVGVACGADFGDSDPLRLLAAAELAVQRANALGSRRAVVYRPPADVDGTHLPTLFADMLRAVEDEEFVPYLQPVVSLTTGAVLGAEAVARWAHPEHGLLVPAEFLVEAERSGLIRRIDKTVRRKAMQAGATWPAGDLTLSVNLSGADLDEAGLVDDVANCLAGTGFSPPDLVLEVTETTLSQDWSRAREHLGALKDLGLHLAVDDFGTGHMYLDRLTCGLFDFLKIDRSLVAVDGSDRWRSDALLRGVTKLAHDQGMRVVAEGIETIDQLERVVAAGCDMAQGYHFGRPGTPSQFLTLLT